MSRMIFCQKLKKQAEGLQHLPYPGPLGQKIFDNISQEAWDLWLARQIMFINEYRLSLLEPSAKKMLKEEMERFLFEDESAPPEGFKPIAT